MNNSKLCSKCGVEKPIEEYSIRKDKDRNGVVVERVNCVCRACICEKQKRWMDTNPEAAQKALQRLRDKYNEDPERGRQCTRNWRASKSKEELNALYKKYNANRDRFEVALKQSHRTSIAGGYKPCNATVEEIREAFTGKCHICGVMEQDCDRKLCLDHCHETGAMRGWLCHKHNAMLGFANESVDILKITLNYLENCNKTIIINEA